MTTRKKWRLQLLPTHDCEAAPSMKRAYERVEEFRSGYASGVLRIHRVNVQVHEGAGWQLYERVIFDRHQCNGLCNIHCDGSGPVRA